MIRCAASGVALALTAATAANAALVISKDATSNVNCAAGVCTATAADAVLNVKDLRSILQHGPLMVVSGPDAQDIEIDQKFTWTQRHHLTLDAFRSILFREAAISEARSAVTLITNDGGSGGDYSFTGRGHISFWDTKSQLVINGQTFTLVNDIATLASDIAANPSGAYALARGYDASVDGTYASAPITTAFTGDFEGLGHAIANVTIVYANPNAIGFFLDIGVGGMVRNLTLLNLRIGPGGKGLPRGDIGGLSADNAGVISDVTLSGGELNGGLANKLENAVGGIVENNTGTIRLSRVNGMTIYGRYGAAGIAFVNQGTVSQSQANIVAQAGQAAIAGGLVGVNHGTVDLSSAAGSVSVSSNTRGNEGDDRAGGLVGENGGVIDRSFSTANVYGGQDWASESHDNNAAAGGLVGYNYGIVTNCYSWGGASAKKGRGEGSSYAGGLVGFNFQSSTIQTSYSGGQASDEDLVGGFLGADVGGVNTSDYWDLDTSGVSNPAQGAGYPANDPGITGLTDAQLKFGLPAGFDPAVWGQSASINNGYPYLLANPPQ